MQFDSQIHLNDWLASPQRKAIIDHSAGLVASIESHCVISSYPGWFNSFVVAKNEIPPLWKQAMLILLVLFPIVMLEGKFLSPFTASLSSSVAMFIGNLISVALVTWPLMPFAISSMGWWLAPSTSKHPVLITVAGSFLLIIIYAVEVWTFL